MQSKTENHTMRVFYLLAIVFVVDGHTTLGNLFDLNGLFRYYSFHLMMFAFGSGYFFKFYGGALSDFVHRAKKLAVDPEVILMDEPTSALDPISTSKIEDLAVELKKKYTIIMVTHNMQQAVRVSDKTVFFLLGEVIESGDTEKLFSVPQDKRTEDYITGRFG